MERTLFKFRRIQTNSLASDLSFLGVRHLPNAEIVDEKLHLSNLRRTYFNAIPTVTRTGHSSPI